MKDTPGSTENSLSVRIIEAATQLFMENGFKGTTTKMIAQKAKVNEATIFRHFNSKEGVFVEVSKEVTKNGHSKLVAIVESGLPPEEMLFQFGMELYNLLVEDKGGLIVAIIESKRRTDLTKNVTLSFRTMIDLLEGKLIALHKAGILKESDYFTVALMYVESMIGLFVVQTRLDGEVIPMEIERLCKSASRIIFSGLLRGGNDGQE